MAARIRLELGAVHRHRAQLDQAALARQAHHLHEQRRQLLQVQRPEVRERAVRRVVLCRQHPQGHIFVQLGRQLARAEGAGGVTVDQHLDHHGRVERLVARPALGIPGVEGAQIQAVHAVADEVRQMPFGQPVLKGVGKQSLLLRFIGQVAHGHAPNLSSLRALVTPFAAHAPSFDDLLSDQRFLDSLEWHLAHESSAEKRIALVIERLRRMAGL
ncbi:hypothetical protein D3C85_1255630 [compost metagenome]